MKHLPRRLLVALTTLATVAATVAVMPSASAAPLACGTANAALNRPATASSTENGGTPASAAVDGNTGTRWSSAFADPQWLQVDLGSTKQVCRVGLNWEAAFGRSFQVQLSNDASNWSNV